MPCCAFCVSSRPCCLTARFCLPATCRGHAVLCFLFSGCCCGCCVSQGHMRRTCRSGLVLSRCSFCLGSTCSGHALLDFVCSCPCWLMARFCLPAACHGHAMLCFLFLVRFCVSGASCTHTHTHTRTRACAHLAYESHLRRYSVAQFWPADPCQHLDISRCSHHAGCHKHIKPHSFVGPIASVFAHGRVKHVACISQHHRCTSLLTASVSSTHGVLLLLGLIGFLAVRSSC